MTALILAMLMGQAAADVPLHDFTDISVWADNRDGGHAPAVSADTEFAREGQAMRIRYTDQPPHWGNLTGPCAVPGDAYALRFQLYVHSAAEEAVMHIWLFEPDNDGWVQRVQFAKGELADQKPGWIEVRMPIAGFSFQARGQKTRQMTSVNRMLIGCNYGDLEVTIDSMSWETEAKLQAILLPRTQGLKIERGERGSVGILDMGEGLPGDFKTAHPPAELAKALREQGFGATLLQAGDLADAELLTPDSLDVVILPFGPFFPKDAKDSFLAYLRAGGSFLSTDGYAFDRLVTLTSEGWTDLPVVGRTAAEMDAEEQEQAALGMNARIGKPGDAMTLDPSQIGVFDPQFHLDHVAEFRPSAWLGDKAPTYALDGPVEGFSACCLTGLNSPVFPPVYRRWIPVLEAFDRAEGLRGTALSLAHNFAGQYPTSSWAFSGITSGQDLFLGTPERRALLGRVVGEITQKVFLHSLATDFACYEPGETAHFPVQVANNGREPARREVTLTVGVKTVMKESLDLAPGEGKTVEASVAVDDFKGDLIPIGARLHDGTQLVDSLQSAFCTHSASVMAMGAKIGWADNYMTVDRQPSFLIGTNQTGMMYFSPDENPATWDRDFAEMEAHGFHIWRILHFSPFAANGYEGQGQHTPADLANRPKRLVRQMDAIVQLAQKHRVAIFLSLHDWLGTVLTDEELAAEADWDRFWAERYRDVPGIFYDIQNEPGVAAVDRPDIVALWNEFLQERYGSDEALRAAWDRNPPEDALPNVPLGKTTDDWYDVRSADRKRFEAVLLNRWLKANVNGIRAGDPDALVCVGYLPSMPPADKILGVKYTSFSNMHYYGAADRFPQDFKIIDRRFQGKGFSLGECGAQEAHDARVNGRLDVPLEASVRRFETYVHYGPAMGGAFIANWDWKEFDEAVFPWGLYQRNSPVTKPWLHTWEQGAWLLSLVEPEYESPSVFVCAPDSNRIGPHFNELNGALTRSVELLLDQRVNFGMANEEDIADLPASAKALFWPVAYCPTDETFERILAWVKAGGTLYVSGDISFDATRKPTRAERRAQLGLPPREPASPFETPDDAWAQPLTETTVGQGKVVYVPYPLEMKGQASDGDVYRRVLDVANVERIRVEPEDAPVRALSFPTQSGGRVTMLVRTTDGEDLLNVSLPEAGVSVELRGKGCAFVITGAKGEIIAAESQGALRIGDQVIAQADGHFGVGALDGKDLRASERLLVLPHLCERVELNIGRDLPKVGQCIWLQSRRFGKSGAFNGMLDFSGLAPGRIAVVASNDAVEQALSMAQDRLERRARR
jgi:hypothetical protein